jgi:predicted RNase H-like HicB family nuclease
MEIVFEVREAEEGGYTAQAIGHSIFTEADSWEQLRANALEAANLHFEDEAERPKRITLHFVKDESIAVEAA